MVEFLLFLPILLFFYLLIKSPLGILPDVGLAGIILWIYANLAERYGTKYASRRCLWCNRRISEGIWVKIQKRTRQYQMMSCYACFAHIRAFLVFAEKHKRLFRMSIVALLMFYIGTQILASFSVFHLGSDDSVGQIVFLGGLGVLAFAFSFLYRREYFERVRMAETERTFEFSFPVHSTFLIGMSALLWVFRIVGFIWIWISLKYLWYR